MARNDQFRRDFARIMQAAGDRAMLVAIWSAMELLKRLISKSPVGNPTIWKNPGAAPVGYVGGRLKNNWVVSMNSPDFTNSHAPDASGGMALARGVAKIRGWSNPGARLFITNSVPYMKRVEYEHWSSQAPVGVVRTTVLEFKQIVRQMASQLP